MQLQPQSQPKQSHKHSLPHTEATQPQCQAQAQETQVYCSQPVGTQPLKSQARHSAARIIQVHYNGCTENQNRSETQGTQPRACNTCIYKLRQVSTNCMHQSVTTHNSKKAQLEGMLNQHAANT